METNEHEVSERQWAKWSEAERRMFNCVWSVLSLWKVDVLMDLRQFIPFQVAEMMRQERCEGKGWALRNETDT